MANPPTVASLEAEVASECAAALAEAGVYLRAVADGGVPFTPAIRRGLRRGLHDVGVATADPQELADSDLVNLSSWATERVLEWGRLHALRLALLHWFRAVQRFEEQAVRSAPDSGGWLYEEKRGIREAVADLEKRVAEPYREPADPMVVSDPPDALDGHPFLPLGGHGRRGCGWL